MNSIKVLWTFQTLIPGLPLQTEVCFQRPLCRSAECLRRCRRPLWPSRTGQEGGNIFWLVLFEVRLELEGFSGLVTLSNTQSLCPSAPCLDAGGAWRHLHVRRQSAAQRAPALRGKTSVCKLHCWMTPSTCNILLCWQLIKNCGGEKIGHEESSVYTDTAPSIDLYQTTVQRWKSITNLEHQKFQGKNIYCHSRHRYALLTTWN